MGEAPAADALRLSRRGRSRPARPIARTGGSSRGRPARQPDGFVPRFRALWVVHLRGIGMGLREPALAVRSGSSVLRVPRSWPAPEL